MVDVIEAERIANCYRERESPKFVRFDRVKDLGDVFVFGWSNGPWGTGGENNGVQPVFVNKSDGDVGPFFIPARENLHRFCSTPSEDL